MTNNNKTEFESSSCNEGKHFFINSEFCDKCNIDFDTWYTKTIEQVRKETCIHVLVSLQSIINEQVSIRQLRKEVGNYIYDAVKSDMLRKRWIDRPKE